MKKLCLVLLSLMTFSLTAKENRQKEKNTNTAYCEYCYDQHGNLTDKIMTGKSIHYGSNLDTLKKYDSRGNLIYEKSPIEVFYTYDDQNRNTGVRLDGYKCWKEYDSNGNLYSKDTNGDEEWIEYDSNKNQVHYKHTGTSNLEYFQEFDSKNRLTHYRETGGEEYWNKYNSDGRFFHKINSDGVETWTNLCDDNNEIKSRLEITYNTTGKPVRRFQ